MKLRQQRLLGLGLIIAVVVSIVLYEILAHSQPKHKDTTSALETVSLIEGTSSPKAAEKMLLERTQNQLKTQGEQLNTLKQALEQLKTTPLLPELSQDKNKDTAQSALPIRDQQPMDLPSTPLLPVAEAPAAPQHIALPFLQAGADKSTVASAPPALSSGIEVDTLDLKPLMAKPQKNPDSFVPAGTFVRAVMLGAADASAGVMGQANPSPMLFRLISEGELPNHAHSHLKDCVVTAAVVGDISSERGHVRLERLSCTFARGEVVEQTVEGTVFALDAKNGVRGRPLWREGALLTRATLAGTLSGLAGSLSSLPLTGTKASTPALDSSLLKSGGVQGASSAMEKLAEYNIQRAEQYHPVIQLSAGQAVDVVFLKGFYLDGRSHNEVAAADSPPTLFEEEPTDSTGLVLSPAQIEKIKQHEAELGWTAGKTESHSTAEGETL